MSERGYIHIRNWDRHQHPDTTRNKRYGPPWIKDYTEQMNDQEYLDLSYADRGLLQAMRLEYALNRGRGLIDSTASLHRLCGQRVMRSQLERLNQAGFIEFSASKVASKPACLDRDKERTPLVSPLDWADDPEPFPDPAPLPKVDRSPFKEIFEHWQRVRDKPRCKLTKDRETKIRARLKDGYSVEDLKTAIDGVAKDDWDQRPLHDDFGVIFRNSQYVDKFIALAANGNGSAPTTAAERYALEVRA